MGTTLVCTDCRLVQEEAPGCRACAGTSLTPPAELAPRRPLTLEAFDWRAMRSPGLLLLALTSLVLFGPALLKLLVGALTGSGLIAELALLAALLLPSLRLLFGAELPQPPEPRLKAARPRLSLRAGQRRRGRVLGDGCVAMLVRARDRRGTYLWRLRAGEFEVLAQGRPLRVCGALTLDGEGVALEAAPAALALPAELPAAGALELLTLHDGDEVELRGPVSREQAPAGYRDSAEIEVMRGVPGNPVEIVLHRRRGPA